MRIGIYLRYSSEKQDDGYSFEVQAEGCRRAVPPGAHQITEYRDAARSGCTIAGRPELLRLLQDAEGRRLDLVLVHRFDRLGRNQAETATLIQNLEDAGVKVASAVEGNDPLARGIHLAISEHYVRVLSERTRAGCQKAAEAGRVGGPAPYGYARAKGEQLTIDESRAAIVRRLFREYVQEKRSLKDLARLFNAEGIPSPRGGEWHSPTIHEILTNEIYRGRLVFNRRRFRRDRRTGRRVYVMNPPEQWTVQERPDLALVPAELWNAAQARRATRAGDPGVSRQSYPLSGLVVCQACGARYVAQPSRNKWGGYVFMTCGNRQTGGRCQNFKNVRMDVLIEHLARPALEAFFTPEAVDEYKDILWNLLEEEFRKGRDGRRQDEAQLRETRENIRTATDEIIRARQRGDGTEGAFIERLAELQRARATIEERLKHAAEQSAYDRGRLSAQIDKAVAEVRAGLDPQATPEQVRETLRMLLGQITVAPDGTITCNAKPVAALVELQRVLACSNGSGGVLWFDHVSWPPAVPIIRQYDELRARAG